MKEDYNVKEELDEICRALSNFRTYDDDTFLMASIIHMVGMIDYFKLDKLRTESPEVAYKLITKLKESEDLFKTLTGFEDPKDFLVRSNILAETIEASDEIDRLNTLDGITSINPNG